MKEIADLLSLQLESRPVANRTATVEPGPEGGLRLSIPLEPSGWLKVARAVFPMSKVRRVELDAMGAQLYSRCTGDTTLEELIDGLADEWKLSFFEARGLVLQFLRPLIRYGMIVMAVPKEEGFE